MKRMLCLSLLVVLISQAGCGPKVADVLKKYEGDFQKKREQFQSIANSLPAKGSVSSDKSCTGINPSIEFNEKNKQYNTEMVMFEHLQDPDTKPKMDIAPRGELLTAILWTGPKNPMSSTILDDRAGDMEQRLKAALDTRYLVVNRIANLAEPMAIDDNTYTPGIANIEVFVVDLADSKALCSFVIEAKPASDVSYSYKAGQSKQEQLQKFAHSTMWEDARKQLIDKLKQVPNSNIELNF